MTSLRHKGRFLRFIKIEKEEEEIDELYFDFLQKIPTIFFQDSVTKILPSVEEKIVGKVMRGSWQWLQLICGHWNSLKYLFTAGIIWTISFESYWKIFMNDAI